MALRPSDDANWRSFGATQEAKELRTKNWRKPHERPAHSEHIIMPLDLTEVRVLSLAPQRSRLTRFCSADDGGANPRRADATRQERPLLGAQGTDAARARARRPCSRDAADAE